MKKNTAQDFLLAHHHRRVKFQRFGATAAQDYSQRPMADRRPAGLSKKKTAQDFLLAQDGRVRGRARIFAQAATHKEEK